MEEGNGEEEEEEIGVKMELGARTVPEDGIAGDEISPDSALSLKFG